jgi:hypothetical protein
MLQWIENIFIPVRGMKKKRHTFLLLYVSIIDRNVEKVLEGAGWSGRKGREREWGEKAGR